MTGRIVLIVDLEEGGGGAQEIIVLVRKRKFQSVYQGSIIFYSYHSVPLNRKEFAVLQRKKKTISREFTKRSLFCYLSRFMSKIYCLLPKHQTI